MRIFRGAIILGMLLLADFFAGAQMRIRSELPNQKINDFYQDGEQFVWISTDYGISRYNGSEYVNYFHSTSDSTSLLSNKVLCAREDSQGRLWVLTDEGVCRLDARRGSFIEVLGGKDLLGMLCLPGRMLCYGRSGFVSISTENGSVSMHAAADKEGIVQAALQKDSLIWAVSGKDASVSCYTLDFKRIAKLENEQSGEVNCLAADGDILWLGTAKGLRLFDTATQRFISAAPTTGAPIHPLPTVISAAPSTGAPIHTLPTAISATPASSPAVRATTTPAAPDYTWLETLEDFSISFIYPYGDNVCICTYGADVFIWHKQRAWLQKSLARRHIVNLSYTSDFSSALCTSDGQLWIGTSDRGYAVYNASEIEFCRGVTIKRITKGKYYNSMTVAPDSIIWMASRYKGLMSVNPALAVHRWYRFIDDTDLKKLGNSGLSTVFCDSSGMLWLNMDENLGVAPVHGLEFGRVKVLGQKLISNAICQDARGDIWIAAEDGLYRFHDYRMEGRFFYGTNISDVCPGPDGKLYCCLSGVGVRTIDPENLANESVFEEYKFTAELNSLRFHPDGSVFFATRNHGLYILNAGKLSHYSRAENLMSPDVESIVFDSKGNTWLGTSFGLSLLTHKDHRVCTYNLNESLQVQQFTSRCAVAVGDYVCLGGVSGIALFASVDLISRISEKPVDLKISSLTSRGRVLDECLKKDVGSFDRLTKVVLPHRDRNLTVNYESVQFYHPEAVKYAWRLKGLEKEWHYVDRSRSANWSYLPAGRYTFELTAVNYDGFWNSEPRRLDIVIKPSPFLSWYAFLIYIILLIGAGTRIMHFIVERRVQKEKLELAVEALEQEKKISGMKVDFFTNISHELRTSLSLIYGPVTMLGTADEKKRKGIIDIIRSNTSSLLVLVDQLLSISRIENDSLPLLVSDIDVVHYLKRIISSFQTLADEKEISIRLAASNLEGKQLPVDADKFQKILQNLLSNAVKYTGKCGHIVVKAELTYDWKLRVSVIDDGIGMSPEEAKGIFERYVRLPSGEKAGPGNGIGLHYVKQLVKLHKGEIEATVRDCGGMEFSFWLPAYPEAYAENERQEVAANMIDGFLNVEAEDEAMAAPVADDDTSKPLVAVIEDNPQLSAYLKTILGEEFRVITAANAEDGLDLITAEMPDIVTTDVMMKGMDGYELCRTVKDNPLLSHIPVVILTAKVAEEDKISGYRNKANAYITKPFNPELLLAVIRNLIEERDKLRKAILSPGSGGAPADSPVMSEHDSSFLSRLNGIIEKNISEPLSGPSELAEMMQISRSTFFRKVKALTGVSPNEYVIIYKLNKSVEMLREGKMNVSEIAYALGFSSPSHFSNTFKNRFGVSPKNY